MSRFYIWTGHKVIGVDNYYLGQFRHAFIYEPQAPRPDYMWKVLFKAKLTRRDKRHMPKEFLMHLLLMEVQI